MNSQVGLQADIVAVDRRKGNIPPQECKPHDMQQSGCNVQYRQLTRPTGGGLKSQQAVKVMQQASTETPGTCPGA